MKTKTKCKVRSLMILLSFVMIVGMLGTAVLPSSAEDTVTVYFIPNANWVRDGARFAVYAYGGAQNAGWTEMTPDGDVYSAVIAADRTHVIFGRMDPSRSDCSFTPASNGGPLWNRTPEGQEIALQADKDCFRQYDDTWDGVGAWETYVAPGFYLVGNLNNWTLLPEYKFSVNPANADEFILLKIPLTTDRNADDAFWEFKVKTPDGQWYPNDAGNFGANGEIAKEGVYDIYFRPDYQGESDWFRGCIFADRQISLGVYNEVLVSENNGVFSASIVGTASGMDDVDCSDFDRIALSAAFTTEGDARTKTVDVRQLYSTVTGVASVFAETANAQGIVHVRIDDAYLFVLRVNGIPRGNYSVTVTLTLYSRFGDACETRTRTIDFTVG